MKLFFYVRFNDLRELRDCLAVVQKRKKREQGEKNISENGKNEMDKLKI